MTQEDKELLLKDLCARLLYSIKVHHYQGSNCILKFINLITYAAYVEVYDCIAFKDFIQDGQRRIFEYKPYLRPMSSMTKEERNEYDSKRKHICDDYNRYCFDTVASIDWLNAHHFDYRGLIEKGLAIAVTEENNPYKEK